MPLPPPPGDLLAQINNKKGDGGGGGGGAPSGLAAALAARQQKGPPAGAGGGAAAAAAASAKKKAGSSHPVKQSSEDPFEYSEALRAFLFFGEGQTATSFVPTLVPDVGGQESVDILVPLAPCAYRMTDYTLAKKEPVDLDRCVEKLGVLRCLSRECKQLNQLLWHRLCRPGGTLEEDELGKARFMELLSNCGVYQKVSEMILQRAAAASDACAAAADAARQQKQQDAGGKTTNEKNPYKIPQVRVEGLDEFLKTVDEKVPGLRQAREEISQTQSVSFYPGLGELFCPGSKLLCHPEGMEGSPLGCSVVQCWYAHEVNKATNKIKRRFVLVVEFIVSVGDELVFVAASDVYPEFHDVTRNVPVRDLTHRKLMVYDQHDDENAKSSPEDVALLQRLQSRGEFYASVATSNHYLEYFADCFFPIIRGGGWNSNAVRPLSKGGRVMVDVKRGILEGHLPVRSTSDGTSDTVKEAIKLFEQSKRTGVAVPFRTALLPGFFSGQQRHHHGTGRGGGSLTPGDDGIGLHSDHSSSAASASSQHSDRVHLWQCWPMLTGFSFTARVWGKLLLGMPKPVVATSAATTPTAAPAPSSLSRPSMSSEHNRRASVKRMGVELAALGGEGACGNCGYISFQEKAFDQLVLAPDKKELIRAVARNAGGGTSKWDDFEDGDFSGYDEDMEQDEDDIPEDAGLDVVANKGGASIFLLNGPPGCGKTLTAEAIAELLKKPLYIVTAGDLGITAAEVEKSLGSVLELCQTWDALVLIDEADLFLEARRSTEIQRNALVCVMLRLLEYYSGCLFLSSNREASSIDAAIASRITVMLTYPPLDAEGRKQVWHNLITLVPALPLDPTTKQPASRVVQNPRKASRFRTEFSDDDYQTLADQYPINGRQIKNSIVLARALAKERGQPLSLPILHRAVTAVAGNNSNATAGASS